MGESVTNPFVTILVPSRNEARFIRDCLLSILANSYPKDLTEVLVIDGLSDDGTRKEVERIAADSMRVKMVDNPRRTTPCALNVGIQQAKGDVVVRMDAHATYPQDYISKLIDWQRKAVRTTSEEYEWQLPLIERPWPWPLRMACHTPSPSAHQTIKPGSLSPNG